MKYPGRRIAACAVLVCGFVLSCSRDASSGRPVRLAILPIENLTNDTGLDWLGAASSAVLTYDLTGLKDVVPVRTPTIEAARSSGATRYVEGYFEPDHGKLAFRAQLEDAAKHTVAQELRIDAAADSAVQALDGLARQIDPRARAFPHCTAEAMRLYGEALEGRGAMQAAVDADANCGPAYVAGGLCAGLKLPSLNAIDRLELQYTCATAQGDTAGRVQALQALAPLVPADSSVTRALGELQVALRRFPDAIRSFQAAVHADAGDSEAWNQLGYAQCYAGDLPAAKQSMQEYAKLVPATEANGLDSLGEISFFLGDFTGAEKYFLEANQKATASAPGNELLKAAQARLMTGDVAGADALIGRPGVISDIDRARWEFITGRREQAIARLEKMPNSPPVAEQLAIWRAQTGKAAWPDMMSTNPLGRAIALLFAGKFADAAPILEGMYENTNPAADAQVRTLLAWSYVQSGRADAARPLLNLYPIPLAGADPALASLVFPRFVQLRAQVLHSQKDAKLAATLAR